MNPADAEKLAALWTNAQPTVRAFVRTVLRRPELVDEVLQETAVEIVRKFREYDQTRPFVPWAIGIARFKLLGFRRQRATDRHVFDDELVGQIAGQYSRQLDYSESVSRYLNECRKEITGPGRRVIELYYGGHMSTADVGKALDMPTGTIRSLLTRARAALRKCIERRLAAEERA